MRRCAANIAFKGLPLELGALLDDLGNLAGIPIDHRRVSFCLPVPSVVHLANADDLGSGIEQAILDYGSRHVVRLASSFAAPCTLVTGALKGSKTRPV